MNQSHYPSLELCKRLTEANFPSTEKCIWDSWSIYPYPAESFNLPWESLVAYRCPSIAELLDKLPEEIDTYELVIYKNNSWYWSIKKMPPLIDVEGTIPNALAEMWLWLIENWYINRCKEN